MNRAPKTAPLVAVVVATLLVAAGAGAHAADVAARASDWHAARAREVEALRIPGQDRVAELAPPAGEVVAEPLARPAPVPDAVDWGNPYDLLLHKIPWGKMRDMR